MLNRREGLKAALALAGLAAAGRAWAAGPAVVSVAEQRNRFFVDVGVNRGSGYRFVLDTGTNAHIISTRIIEQLRLPRIDRRMVRGYEGRNRDNVVGINRLTVGGVDLGHSEAIAWTPQRLEQHDGIIGYPFLYPTAVLDLGAGVIALGAGPAEGSVEVAADVGRNQALLEGGFPGADGRFVFDTGAQFFTISAGYHTRIAATEAYRGAAKLVARRADGSSFVSAFRPEELAFGDLRMRREVVRIGESDGQEGVFLNVDGLFGVNVIRPYIWALDQEEGVLTAASSGIAPAGLYGSGFSLHRKGALALVSAVHEGGPAEAAGVRPGQRVVALSGRPPQAWDAAFLRDQAWRDRPQVAVLELEDGGRRRTIALAGRRLL